MTDWEDLVGLADPSPPPGPTEEVLVASSADAVGQVAEYVQAWFGADDDRRSLRLVLDGSDRGVLYRSTVYSLAVPKTRGTFGQGDYAAVPGHAVDFHPLRLACPAEGCHVRAAVVSYDADDPPLCPLHHVQLRIQG
jgi:hypothetical protein